MLLVYWFMPSQTLGDSWQLAQLPLTPAWIMLAVGAGTIKPLPGTLRGTFTDTRPAGVLAAWQVSQVVKPGMWELGPGPLEGGISTMAPMPKNWLMSTVGPWQLAQPLRTLPWLNWELAKWAPSCTGSCTLLPAPTWQASQLCPFMLMWLAGGDTRAGTSPR